MLIARYGRALAPALLLVSACAAGCSALHHAPAHPPPPAAATLPRPTLARMHDARTGSSVVLARSAGKLLAFAADADENTLHAVDLDTRTELSVTPLSGSPSALLVLPDGRLAVALRDQAAVVVLCARAPAAPLEPCARAGVPDDPVGLALTPDDGTLLVTSGWAHTLTALDAGTLARRFDQDLPREPRAVVVSDDGQRAFVSHAVGGGVSVVDLTSTIHAIHHVSVDGHEPQQDAMTAKAGDLARSGEQGYALAKVGPPAAGRILAPEVLVFSGDPTQRSSGYGGGESFGADVFAVAVVDEDAGSALADSLTVSTKGTDCLLPRAAARGPGATALVACVGTDEVLEIDGSASRPSEAIQRRWRVPAGPNGIAVDEAGARAVVWSAFARAVSVLSLAAPRALETRAPEASFALPRGVEAVDPQRELGRALFHATSDPRIAKDGRACASCHPDGRDDGLTWSTPNGPRQTPMLAGRLEGTAPYAWNGDGATLEKHLGHTMQRLSGSGLSDRELAALVAYIATMKPPAVSRSDDAKVARGAAVFDSGEAGCSECHGQAGAEPDHLRHDLHTKAKGDSTGKFDTPSLRFVAGTAPYFHDGRYPTLHALLEHTDGQMGHTRNLSPADLDALEAYLRTL